jgi:hypothetical protein
MVSNGDWMKANSFYKMLFASLTLCVLLLSVSLVGINLSFETSGTDDPDIRAGPPPDKNLYTPPSISNIFLIGKYESGKIVNTTNITKNFLGTRSTYDSGAIELHIANCIMVQIYRNSKIIIFVHDDGMLNAQTIYRCRLDGFQEHPD